MTKQQKFAHYYEKYIQDCTNFAQSITHNKNTTEEIVQESMIKAFRRFEKFDPNLGSFKNWAFTIIKNTYITRYNRKKKNNIISMPVEECAFALDQKKHAHNAAINNIKLNSIHKCIDELSEKSRKPIKLYIHGYQYNEISEQLQIPIGTVKSRINFARTKLRNMLSDQKRVA